MSRLTDYINQKLQTSRFSDKYFTNYPKLTRIFNKGLPIALVSAVVVGLGIATWQIVSLAKSGEARASVDTVSGGGFKLQGIIRGSQNRNEFNVKLSIDGRVIESRVNEGVKKDEVKDFTFRSGKDGDNQFYKDLLRPGNHTFKAEFRTGVKVGQGTLIDEDEAGIKVEGAKNIIATGEGAKSFSVDQLPLNGSPRNALAPNWLVNTLAIANDTRQNLLDSLLPKASAHDRRGDKHSASFRVVFEGVAPGTPVQARVTRGANAQDCHGGDDRTGAAPAIDFGNCTVDASDNSSNYMVYVNTPEGYIIEGPHDRPVRLDWKEAEVVTFNFRESKLDPPPPVESPKPSQQAQSGGTPAPTKPKVSVDDADYTPDDGPMIALNRLDATSAEVSAFGFKMVDNRPARFLRDIKLHLDGQEILPTNGFNGHPTQTNIGFQFNSLDDGGPHELVFIATNEKGQDNQVAVRITPRGAPAANNTPTPAAPKKDDKPPAISGKGSVEVTVFAHSQENIALNKASDARVGDAYVSMESLDHPSFKCKDFGGNDSMGAKTDDQRTLGSGNDKRKNPNFGQINFFDCPAGKYKLNYTLGSEDKTPFRPDPAFNGAQGITFDGERLSLAITVQDRKKNEKSFLVVGSGGSVHDLTPSTPGSNVGGVQAPDESQKKTDASKPYDSTGVKASGRLVLFSDQGRYDRAFIYKANSAAGSAVKDPIDPDRATCGEFRLASQPEVAGRAGIYVDLQKDKPVQLRCSSSSYYVVFLKSGESFEDLTKRASKTSKDERVSVAISSNNCSYLHRKGVSHVAAINKEGACPGIDSLVNNAVQERLQPVLTAGITPSPAIIGQKLTYSHELKLPDGEPLSPEECAGHIIVKHIKPNSLQYTLPIRYNANSKTCTYVFQSSAQNSSGGTAGNYDYELRFEGNIYLKPAEFKFTHQYKRL